MQVPEDLTKQEYIEFLVEESRKLPLMTEDQIQDQGMDFAYGNLACSTNHKPTREGFASLAKELGWTDERFAEWAAKREWWDR